MNKITAFSIVGALTLTVCLVQSSSALTGAETDMFSQNDITFWDPDECGARGNTKVAVCGVTLPAKTVQQLDNEKVKESAEKNIDRYKYAEEQTGVPWQAIAALHYREASMASDASISNGQKLTSDGSCYTNVDNIKICGDANKDAEQAAKHLLEMGKSVYGVDILSNGSQEAFGKAFLAYNRGYMYESAGAAWDTSPYVMNGFDEDHMNMKWQHADSWYKGEKLNSVEGGTDGRPGALAVFAYLCGNSSSSSSDQTSNTSGGVSGSNITWIGDSYSVGASDIISEKFSGVDFGSGTKNTSASYIQGSKFVGGTNANNPPCLTILENIIKNNSLRPYVVFACGTNGGWSESDISKFKDLLKNTTSKAIVVTSKIPSNSYTESNKRLQDLANANDDIFLADWTAVYEESYFSGDPEKIHPVSGDGYKKWVGVISDALSKAAGDSCTTYEGKYPEYAQCDPKWGSLPYGGSGDTICNSGCGASSMAMLATVATGQDIFPNDIADLLGDKYYWNTSVLTNDPIVGKHYGFEVVSENFSTISEAETKIRDYLKKGYMIHMTGAGCYPGFQSGGNCTKGHLIGIYSIDDNDNILLANSAFDGNQTYPLSEVVKAIKWGVFTAIKGSNNRNTCSGLCPEKGGGAIQGGLSEEEAQKLANYYNSSAVTASSFPGGHIPAGTKTNCVSFSVWFIHNFTDAKSGTYGGNGKDVAKNLHSQGGFEAGSDPRPFAVFGVPVGSTMCGSSPCGHTGIVVAVNGNQITTVEAGYNSYDAKVVTRDISYFKNSTTSPFTYTDGHIDLTKLNQIINK